MKKIVFMLIAAFSVMLTSCSAFDSEPIEPKIIGCSNLQYEAKTDTWFVEVDSTQYTIISVTIPDNSPRTLGNTQEMKPVEGMLVTVFTSPRMKGLQAVTGKQSVEQIEEFYHTNDTGVVIVFGVLLLCVIGLAIQRIK
jgi:hypothetical protein